MPKMGDTMEEGKILSWHKHEGDTVEKGEALAEIETEKVNIEAESFAAGVLRKILVHEGQSVPVGAPIALVGAASEPLPAEAPARTTAEAVASVPQAGRQTNAAPERVSQAAVQPAAPMESRTASNGSVAGSGDGRTATLTSPAEHDARTFISPIARRIAQEHALDITRISGTGPGGRIVREDVEAALAGQQAAPQPAAPPVAPTPTTELPVAADEAEAIPLTAMRRTIARRLQQSMQTAPHFYVTMAIDTTRLAEFRASVNGYTETLAQPLKISVNDLIVKASAVALAHMPEINVSFDGERLLRKKHVNIGMAVALEQGLIVPVVRDADRHGLVEIARETRRLAEAARTGKLTPQEFSGGTFSISNLGMYGVEEFTAVINPPESAILAVGAIEPVPVVRDGQVVVRDRMKVTLSVDHRAIDGAQAARFLQELKRLLEQPMAMLV